MAAIIHSDGRVEIIRDVIGPGDSRLTDPREPTDHASSHVDNGPDEIDSALDPRAYPIRADVLANRGATSGQPCLFYATDQGILYRSDGTTWTKIVPALQHGGDHADNAADEITSALDPRTYPVRSDTLANRGSASPQAALFYATDQAILYRSNGTTWSEFLLGPSHLPWMIDIPSWPSPVAQTNWNTRSIGPTGGGAEILFNSAVSSSGAQNDEIGWDVVLAAGTWDFELIHHKNTDRGIYTVYLDSTNIGTIDGYLFIGYVGNQIGSITGITVATSAKYRLKLKMATKNGGSSNYYGDISHIRLIRTA